ncbi:MAG TPA: 2-C-methyl-D-erythritol 4-phosphate cytidylyltransferase [Candidatus Eubacterium faecipullorum]|uniref:2-C-methyl-D-erythritol 4-phosphate cytidylyltransferase n=1 Tax=Candidatus Eubacterium faecipullorum TaxID=2838571 RepID=A0A9D1REU4_9FIRM|nr:2-C-methyl-D-erythritol 4-phosphate cytidylyltransferase [Candidatus Eubacterium faecipullorum]
MYNIAVIVAAGNGTRMGTDKSKLLLEIGGKTVIERTVETFENMAEIDEIIVVCRECDFEEFSRLLPGENISFVFGGATRQQSVKNAVDTIEECDYIIIHDGARPLVLADTVIRTLDKAQTNQAAAVGVYVKDTVKLVDDDLNIAGTPNRKYLVSIQTPQIFDFKLYKNALDAAVSQGRDYTDDCQLVENIGSKVSVVIGEYDNIKITTKSDIPLAESFLNARSEGNL